ncbi:PREDICTED: C-type lectin 37Da-like [Nicrophorus vespilloides]|uniref:C-type lectin 37Da-like n=1 Tax=Nicrophorus vespilloides TaxID=110193 RepID=A0ABM1NAV9_NICVS|nr:PREDICTED: C-type lectin 37Da-like [Nicrophorus vespilloides]
MSTRFLISLVLCAATIYVLPEGRIVKRQVTHTFKNKQYYVETLVKANFHNAFMFCQRLGMQLLTIDSNDEYDYIFNTIKSEFNFGRDSKLWTSGTDLGHEGKFHWLSTGFSMKINKWLSGQPDNDHGRGEHCVEFWNNKGSIGLNDDRCHITNYFICEKRT